MSSFTDSSPAVLEPITATLRDRLRYEYESLKSPPSPARVAVAGLSALGVATFLGTLFATNGFLEELLAGETQAVAAFATAVAIMVPWMIYDIHDTHYEQPQAVTPETNFDRVVLWIHARVDPIVARYYAVEKRVLSPFASIRE